MIEDYEAITNMTNAQAAEVLENMRIRIMGGRCNGKTKLVLSYEVAIQKAIQKLKDGWIACVERLPGEQEPFSVLCCDSRGEMLIAHPFEDDASNTGYSAESDECYMYDCVAWRLLPEPYKEA